MKKPIVIENSQGSAISIAEYSGKSLVEVTVQQEAKKAKVTCEYDVALIMDYHVGDWLIGRIVTWQSTTPPIEEYPEEHLLWRDGKVVRTSDGKAIYEIMFYSEDPKDVDVLLC